MTAVHYLLNTGKRAVVICTLFDSKTLEPLAIGYAIHNPEDAFSFGKGSKIARGRAEKAFRTGRHIMTRCGDIILASRSFIQHRTINALACTSHPVY